MTAGAGNVATQVTSLVTAGTAGTAYPRMADTSLRTTIDILAASLSAAGTRVVACYNYIGTPYVGREVLPELVYAYGPKEAIDKAYLKKVTLHGYANTRTDEFVDIAIESFLKETNGLRPEGLSPKLTFFTATIDELNSELKPAVERALLKHGIPTSRILVNVGDDKLTTNDDIREFNRLDTEGSEKQFILLVNKGREGWNCRSLFGVGLFREPKSKVFVLQATMRLTFPVLLPMCPGPLGGGVIHQLVKVGGHLHSVGADAWPRICKHRPSDHKHIPRGTFHVVPRVLFDLAPGATVVLGNLGNHIREAEALSHGGRCMHVSGRRHVASAVAGVLVVLQFRAFSAGQTRICKEPFGPPLIRIFDEPALARLSRCPSFLPLWGSSYTTG